ncbi:MAG: AtpZ/AtpI family protein [Planctomycetota bacterium]
MKTQQKHDSGNRRGSSSPVVLRYAGMGVELAAALIGLTLVGWWIDHRYGTAPVGVTVGAILGIVGGFYNFIRQALRLMRESEAARKNKPAARDNNAPDTK